MSDEQKEEEEDVKVSEGPERTRETNTMTSIKIQYTDSCYYNSVPLNRIIVSVKIHDCEIMVSSSSPSIVMPHDHRDATWIL
jgi:hypothetical protein